MDRRNLKRWTVAGTATVAAMVWAGNLDSPAPPSEAGSAMFTLEDVYNKLDTGADATKRAGGFAEPGAAPGSTGHTLDQVMDKTPAKDNANGAEPADVADGKTFWGLKDGSWGPQTGTATVVSDGGTIALPKTGQTTSYAAGDDGDLEGGVAWPNPRFTDNGDGTVTDNLTRLMWLRNANAFGAVNWATALNTCATLNNGEAGLTDGSNEGDWRLPNLNEIQSLVHRGVYDPAIPNTAGTGQWSESDPFTGVQSTFYWSSTTGAGYTDGAWGVVLIGGNVNATAKTGLNLVWPVRGGN